MSNVKLLFETIIFSLIFICSICSCTEASAILNPIIPTEDGRFVLLGSTEDKNSSICTIYQVNEKLEINEITTMKSTVFDSSQPILLAEGNSIWQYKITGENIKIIISNPDGTQCNRLLKLPENKEVLRIDVVPEKRSHSILIYMQSKINIGKLDSTSKLQIKGESIEMQKVDIFNGCISCEEAPWSWLNENIKLHRTKCGSVLSWIDTDSGQPVPFKFDIFLFPISHIDFASPVQIPNPGHDRFPCVTGYKDEYFVIWSSHIKGDKPEGHTIMWAILDNNTKKLKGLSVLDQPFPDNPSISFQNLKTLSVNGKIYLFAESFSANDQDIHGNLFVWQFVNHSWHFFGSGLKTESYGQYLPYLSRSGEVSVMWSNEKGNFKSVLKGDSWSELRRLSKLPKDALFILEPNSIIIKRVENDDSKLEIFE